MPKKKQSSSMNVPPKWIGQDKRFAETLKENVDVLAGHRGDPLDAAITARDLIDSGIVKLSAGANFYSGASSDIVSDTVIPDLDIPPAPYNLAANGAFQNILLTWNIELYSGHSFFEVLRHTSNVVASATVIGTQSGLQGIYSDSVGGGQTYYYWVRAVNQNGIRGPLNSSTGTLGQTQADTTLILGILTDQITTSQLATSLTTPIALIPSLSGSITALDTYTGITAGYSGDNLLSRINSAEVVASTTTSAVATLNTSLSTLDSTVTGITSSNSTRATAVDLSVATLNTAVSNLQGSVSDLTSGVSAVYVQASQPTGTITTNSRWYDNDDNMKPYFYNGTAWIALDDPRIASNQVSINSLNAQVFNGDGTVKLATASALSVLDATVVVQGNSITSVSADVTALNNSVYNADGTLELATSSALSTLSGTVTTQGNTISTVQTDITNLEGEVFNADGTSKLATGSALSGLSNSVTAIYDGTNASVIKSVQTDVTALEGEVFNADGTSKLATGSALSGLTNSVTAIYDGTNASVVKSVQTDVTALEGEVFNADGTSRLATGSALSGLTNSVTAIYDGTNTSVVKSVQTDVTALEGEVFSADGTARLATSSALGGLTSSVEAIYDGTNASVVKSVQTDISTLNGAVFNDDGTVAIATTAAISGLTSSVEAIYDGGNPSVVKSVQTDVSSLEGEVFKADGSARLATGSALTGVSNSVSAIYDGTNASVVKSVQVDVSALEGEVFNADGTARLATTSVTRGLSNSITAIYDGGNPSVVKTVQGDVSNLKAEVFSGDGTSLLATLDALSGVSQSVEAIYNPSNPDAVTQISAVQSDIADLNNTVFTNDGVALATTGALAGIASKVTAIYDPDTNDPTVVTVLQSDIADLETVVLNENGTSKLATGSALALLTNDVRVIYNGADAASLLKTVQEDLVILDGAIYNDDGTAKLASATATSLLQTEVWGTGVAPAGATTSRIDTLTSTLSDPATGLMVQAGAVHELATAVFPEGFGSSSALTALENAVFDDEGTVKLATALAFGKLHTEVFGDSGSAASRIDGLQAVLFDDEGVLQMASAGALETLDALVTGDNAIATKVSRLAASMYVDSNTDGELNLATAADFERVETQVFPEGSTASRISQLSAALWDGGDPTGELTLATADFAENLNVAVFGTETGQGASANKIEQLQVTIAGEDGAGGLTAAINTTQEIVGTAETGLSSQYAVKIDTNNGAVAGFGLSSTTNDQGNTTSAFIVSADRFAIMDPNGGPLSDPNNPNSGTASVPFVYTSAQLAGPENGNVAVDEGVYIDTAFIKNGSITTAQIGTATIDTANITGTLSANKIVGGQISTSLLNIDGSSIRSQTIGGVSKLILGDVNVNKLVGNSISASIMSGTSVFADKLSGDVNTLVPFRSFANQAYGGAETTMIEVDLPASSHPLGHKPFAICSGYMEPRFERVYRFRMYMKTAIATTANLGQPLVASFNVGGGGSGVSSRYLEFSGDISGVVSIGQVLTSYMAVKTGTVTSVSVGSNITTITYSGNVFSTSDTITTTTSTDYVLVGETRTKSRTATRLMFSLTGSKSVPDTGVVGMKVTVTQMNSQDTGFDTTTSNVRINEVSGMIMGVR